MIRLIVLGVALITGVSCKTTSRDLRMPVGGLGSGEQGAPLKSGVLSAREMAETGAARTIGVENKGNQGVVTAPIAQGPTTVIIQDVHPFSRIHPRGYQPVPYGYCPPGQHYHRQPVRTVRQVPLVTVPGFR